MKKEQIENMIDKKIEKHLSSGSSMPCMMEELGDMSVNMQKSLSKMGIDAERYARVEFEDIEPIRARYIVHYVKHCLKRSADLAWLERKKEVLGKTNIEMFRLLKFKEKMTC